MIYSTFNPFEPFRTLSNPFKAFRIIKLFPLKKLTLSKVEVEVE